MSMPWPEDLGSGTVLWDLGFMKADNDDSDRSPQLTAGTGITVNFSPDVSQAVRYNGVDGNKTIMPLLSQGIINDEGLLCTMSEDGTPDVVGVVLPATDSETMTPRNWTYTVTVLDNRIIINRFSISLATGAEIDLADYAPVDSSGGTHIVTERETALRAERAAGQAETFRNETRTDRQAAQSARDEAQGYATTSGGFDTRLGQIETMAGLEPGEVTDAQTANLVTREDTSTRAAVNAVSTHITEAHIVSENIPGQVRDEVAGVVAGDPTIVDSVAQRVLSTDGIVTGASRAIDGGETAWAHTTDPVHGITQRLPLGYRADGHLDDFARRIWLEDTEDATITYDPHYRMVRQTPDGHIIYAEKFDGTVLIPGLVTPSRPVDEASEIIYADVPDAGGEVRPIYADTDRLAIWGSSTMRDGNSHYMALATELDMEFYQGGSGGEKVEAHAARLGAIPARLTFPLDIIPASGSVEVQISNMIDTIYMKSFEGTVVGKTGEVIAGTLSHTTADRVFTFTRSEDGESVYVNPDIEFTPIDGHLWRNATTLIQAGKNNLTRSDNSNDPVVVADKTVEMVKFLSPLQKRVLVIGQFVNTNTAAVSPIRDRIFKSDDLLAERLGPLFVNVREWLMSGKVWEDAEVSPTEEDLAQAAMGNLPPTLGLNAGHFNTLGYQAYVVLIKRVMSKYGWIAN